MFAVCVGPPSQQHGVVRNKLWTTHRKVLAGSRLMASSTVKGKGRTRDHRYLAPAIFLLGDDRVQDGAGRNGNINRTRRGVEKPKFGINPQFRRNLGEKKAAARHV